jgi:predicted nucleic-acid-binding protein
VIAFDTSLIVRIATGDDQKQKAVALALLANESVFIPKTVILETEWVLRSRYGLTPTEILAFLSHLVSSVGIVVEDAQVLQRALVIYDAGTDFADALHAASAGELTLYTLDKGFCRKARKAGMLSNVQIATAR